MRPQDDAMNGHESGSGGTRSSDSEGEELGAVEGELSLVDEGAPARALAALNALRKARQHYDVLLAGGDGGEEVAAHRAVLAAASPRLLGELPAAGAAAAPALRLPDVEAAALRDLVEYAYTGRLRVRDHAAARRLYRAAARLRVEAARAHLAERLLRRLSPHDALSVRALPDLQRTQRAHLDAYIAQHFDEICACGALAALPLIRIEMLRETSAQRGEEAPAAVAEAALLWLRAQLAQGLRLEELCARTHLLFVDAGGALRDCGELPELGGEGPELLEYRREAAERERGGRARRERAEEGGAAEEDTGVVAARAASGGQGVTRAVLALRGRLAGARVAWRAGGGGGQARGGRLGGPEPAPEPEGAPRRAHMSTPRCALGAAVVGGRLLVCGGYDRERVLRSAEAYEPDANAWVRLPEMRSARARFPAAALGGALYVVGGSDGHAELESVDALVGGAWRARARLPPGRSHAAAAADEARGVLYVAGGWAAGRPLRSVHRYSPLTDSWDDMPPLNTGRSQCAGVLWEGELWVLGGCDAWHCLASTERLALGGAGGGGEWRAGAALPTARRSVGGAVWRGRLVAGGGSAGSASLRLTAWLGRGAAAWREGPPLREPRAAPALAVLRDALYAAGGFSGQQFLSSVECLYDPDGCWTTLCAPHGPAHLPLATHTCESEEVEARPEMALNGSPALEERVSKMAVSLSPEGGAAGASETLPLASV